MGCVYSCKRYEYLIKLLLLLLSFYIVKHFYHEPVAWGTGRPPPVYLTLNKLSYLILSYLILSYLILSYLILSYLILSYLILSYLILSYLILSYLILCLVSFHREWALPYFTLSNKWCAGKQQKPFTKIKDTWHQG